MSAYRLVTHITLSLSIALPHVRLVNDPVKQTGVFPLNPFNTSDLTGVMKNQNTVISMFVFSKQWCLLRLRMYIFSTNMVLHTCRSMYTHTHKKESAVLVIYVYCAIMDFVCASVCLRWDLYDQYSL